MASRKKRKLDLMEEPLAWCPECGSHKIFIDEKAAMRDRVQTVRCSMCEYAWDEPSPVNGFAVEMDYDGRLVPDFPRALRLLADQLEKTGVREGWGDLPGFPGTPFKGHWKIKENI